MNPAKIRLSEPEMKLVNNADWILTKNQIMTKAWSLLESVQYKQQQHNHENTINLPASVFAVPAKISKGENYHGLPYLVLDQPRYFDKENVFAIRTMFWWGNFFSITLHLSGIYKIMYADRIGQELERLSSQDFFICIHGSPWEYHFGEENFTPLNSISSHEGHQILQNHPFIKLAKKFPLTQWENAIEFLENEYFQLLTMLNND